jgi:phage terminase Nu1 subunit (DNA packaging protein)
MTDFKSLRLSLADICWLLGLTKQRVNQLEADGVIQRLGRNKYAIGSIPRYLKLMREVGRGPKKWQEARTELVLEKLRMAKLDREERERTLLPAQDVINWNVKFVSVVRLALLAIPSKLAPRLVDVKDAGRIESVLRGAIVEALESLQQLLHVAKGDEKERDS